MSNIDVYADGMTSNFKCVIFLTADAVNGKQTTNFKYIYIYMLLLSSS